MVEDGDTKTQTDDTGDGEGTKSSVADTTNSNASKEAENALDRADAINKEEAANLDREEKLQKRKEDLEAVKQVGGQTVAGQETPTPKEETPKEYRARIEKEMAAGKTDFKEDGN